MSSKQLLIGVLALLLVGLALAKTKSSDFDALASMGEVVGRKAGEALPGRGRVAAPLAPFKLADRLPLEEQVRARIHGDKLMAGAAVEVQPAGAPGELRLRGTVATPLQLARASELAEGAVGVTRVANELALPAGR